MNTFIPHEHSRVEIHTKVQSNTKISKTMKRMKEGTTMISTKETGKVKSRD